MGAGMAFVTGTLARNFRPRAGTQKPTPDGSLKSLRGMPMLSPITPVVSLDDRPTDTAMIELLAWKNNSLPSWRQRGTSPPPVETRRAARRPVVGKVVTYISGVPLSSEAKATQRPSGDTLASLLRNRVCRNTRAFF